MVTIDATTRDRRESAGPLAAEYGLYVDGAWREPEAGRFDDRCPTTEAVVAAIPDASVAQMAGAVGAARRTFDGGAWSEADPAFRASCLRQLGEALVARRSEFVSLARVEWGCTENEDLLQVDAPAYIALGAAELAATPAEEVQAGPAGQVLVRHEPVGVVSMITPWNFPHTINLMKVAPALAAGNTLVLKPSPLAPLPALALARIVDEETDIPPGVVNVLSTSSLEASQALVTDPRVDMVSFTGSTAVGRTIMSAAGATVKKVVLELGGKSACIVLDGVDLDVLLPRLVFEGCSLHAGQACILQSRLLVPDRLHDEVVGRLADLAGAVQVGDPLRPGVEMGPLISADQRRRVGELVDGAVAAGARVVAGGGPIERGRGHFFEPTVLTGVAPDAAIARTEVFGPVLTVLTYRDTDDAVRIANDSPYGLSGAVHGPDDEAAVAVARRIRTGQVAVNGAGAGGAPFGGFKQSGIGREGGLVGMREYTETKAIGLPA
jgi:acyl-CoA reductase-like NAD-dependent aldehyde dehydrogenase